MNKIIDFKNWAAPSAVRRIPDFAGESKIRIKRVRMDKTETIADSSGDHVEVFADNLPPLVIPYPRGADFCALALSVARATGHTHVDIWQAKGEDAESVYGKKPWQAELIRIGRPPIPMTVSPEAVTAAGTSLHGENWHRPLARDLDVNHRTIARWAKSGAPESVRAELSALLNVRKSQISAAIKTLSSDDT